MLPEPLERLRASHPELEVRQEDESYLLGTLDEPDAVKIFVEEDEYVVSTTDWHGHAEELDEAVHLARMVLDGEARTASEYRGEVLASTWLEVFEGDAYEQIHLAMFLDPFDAQAWKTLPEELWKVVRTHRHLIGGSLPSTLNNIPLGETRRTETESDSPLNPPQEWMLQWFSEHYGEPMSGYRWVMDLSHRLVLQMPLSWSRELEQSETEEWTGVTFQPAEEGVALRISTPFRETPQDDRREMAEGPLRPYSSSVEVEERCTGERDWWSQTWELIFSNGEEDMLAQIVLYVHRKRLKEAPTFASLIGAGVETALFVVPGS